MNIPVTVASIFKNRPCSGKKVNPGDGKVKVPAKSTLHRYDQTMQYNSLFSIYKSLVGSDVPIRFDPLQIVPYPEVHAIDKQLSVNLLLVISATPHPWALELQNSPEATLHESDDDYVIRYPGRRITVAKSTGLSDILISSIRDVHARSS